MSEEKRITSVARRKSTFAVAPSPFNAVKFELGVILLVGMLLLLIQWRISNMTIQFLLLLGYGFVGMGWIIFRTYQVWTRSMSERGRNQDESH